MIPNALLFALQRSRGLAPAAAGNAPASAAPTRHPGSAGLRGVQTFVLVAMPACLIVSGVRIGESHYRGPRSDHFDGSVFFNPDGESGTADRQASWRSRDPGQCHRQLGIRHAFLDRLDHVVVETPDSRRPSVDHDLGRERTAAVDAAGKETVKSLSCR